MTDILNLPDWKAISTRQEGAEYIIEADYTIQPQATRMGVMFSDQPLVNLTLMCTQCKVRFHTDGAIHGGPLSTR